MHCEPSGSEFDRWLRKRRFLDENRVSAVLTTPQSWACSRIQCTPPRYALHPRHMMMLAPSPPSCLGTVVVYIHALHTFLAQIPHGLGRLKKENTVFLQTQHTAASFSRWYWDTSQ